MSSSVAVKPLTLLKITQLGNLLGIAAEGDSMSVLVKRGLCGAAHRAGYLVIPHIAPEYVDVSGDDVVTIIMQSHGEALSPSYAEAHLLIELGMSIAMGNGQCEPSEIRQLSYVMERNFIFSGLDVRALTALKDFACIYPPDMDLVTSRLVNVFSLGDCRDIARTMVTVGAAGSIGSGKIIALRKMYEALGLDERELYQRMMGFRYSESGIIEVDPIFEPAAGELEPMCDPTVKLNFEIVATKKRETESVGMILSEIFANED
ncbi:MAG: hypothetical protein LBU26_02745 [Synergistaceae bacterium]|nr:hypothetical protein [Synergistaceae bacterium]